MDKDQFNEDEKNDAQEEQKRRAEENREVKEDKKKYFLFFLYIFSFQATADDGAKQEGDAAAAEGE